MKKDSTQTIEAEQLLGIVENLAAPKKKIKSVAVAEYSTNRTTNPWTDAKLSMNKPYDFDKFVETTSLCRFFYRTEPVVSTVVNKLVEIGINDLVFSKNKLSDNEFRVYKAIKPRLLEFAEQMAQEYLLSGLVVPEVGWGTINDKEFIFSLGVKKLSSLTLPDSMWVRDPKSIKIFTFLLGDKPTYFVKIPNEVVQFVRTGGKMPDGTEQKELFELIKDYYPEFVKAVNEGKTEIPLFNENVIRRKFTSDNPYPISYVTSSLDALQHKRKLRRMDYTLIDKVITAIFHVKVGSDNFPVSESPEDQELLDDLNTQLRLRGNSEQLLERVFQLVTNHTVELSWVFPDVDLLLDNKKYEDINQEILFGLGFPRVLITGESQRTGTSDPELAMLAPVKTMENFRSKIIEVIRDICTKVAIENGFRNAPSVEFKALSLHNFADFINGLSKLYDASALSRTDLAKIYGFDFMEQVDKLEVENTELTNRGLPTFGPTPFGSNQMPQGANGNPKNAPKSEKKPSDKPKEE